MERYNEYKDSGVQWLGEIPSHWEVCKVKHHYKMITGFTPSTGKSEYYSNNSDNTWVTIADMKTKFISESSSHISDLYIKNFKPTIVPKGSLLYSFKLSVGQVAFADKDLYTNEAIASFENNENVCLDFLFYSASICIIKNANTNIYGAFILNQELIKNATIVYPPFAEQKAIANYLDTATAKIDEAIAQQQKMIDLLNERKQIIINNAVTKGLNPDAPMKDSGVVWIGEIPEHWEIKKLKHVCQAFGRIGFRGYSTTDLVDEGEGCITLSPSNMRDGKMQYGKCTYLSWEKYEESPEIKVFNGDILFVKTGSTYGKSSIVEDLPIEATINPQLLVFKNFTCNNMFLANVLQSTAIKTQVEISVIGGTIPTISQQKILNYVFPFPTEDEQYAIVEYVESKSAPINSAIKAAEKQISLLQERKQIIINDVVTGKVKVL